jgi:hypothetical protein
MIEQLHYVDASNIFTAIEMDQGDVNEFLERFTYSDNITKPLIQKHAFIRSLNAFLESVENSERIKSDLKEYSLYNLMQCGYISIN